MLVFFYVVYDLLYVCCMLVFFFFFFKHKTSYEMRISDWISDVCSSDLTDATGSRIKSELRGWWQHWPLFHGDDMSSKTIFSQYLGGRKYTVRHRDCDGNVYFETRPDAAPIVEFVKAARDKPKDPADRKSVV